jgi:ApaG protein
MRQRVNRTRTQATFFYPGTATTRRLPLLPASFCLIQDFVQPWGVPSSDIIELPGLRVTVDNVIYQPHVTSDIRTPYCFMYFITIHNDSEVGVTIRGRKWVVTNGNGEITVVEGDGVVGEFPCLEPGEHFSYHSYHLLATATGAAEGSYLGLDDDGRKVLTRIPKFRMRLPEMIA